MIKGLKAMLAHGDDDICIEDAIRQIEHHVDCIVQDPSYEIPKNVFRLRQAQFKVFCQNHPLATTDLIIFLLTRTSTMLREKRSTILAE